MVLGREDQVHGVSAPDQNRPDLVAVDRLRGRRNSGPSLEGVAGLWQPRIPDSLDRISGDRVHGLRFNGLGRRLFRRFLVENRSACSKAPAPCLSPQPAQKAGAAAI